MQVVIKATSIPLKYRVIIKNLWDYLAWSFFIYWNCSISFSVCISFMEIESHSIIQVCLLCIKKRVSRPVKKITEIFTCYFSLFLSFFFFCLIFSNQELYRTRLYTLQRKRYLFVMTINVIVFCTIVLS